MFKFQKLEVWKKSIELGKLGFKIGEELPQKHQFSFGDQLRRALLSISNNIAEGSGRETVRDQSNFYNMAKGSVYEVVNVLVFISQVGLLNLSDEERKKLYGLADEICKMLSGLMRRRHGK